MIVAKEMVLGETRVKMEVGTAAPAKTGLDRASALSVPGSEIAGIYSPSSRLVSEKQLKSEADCRDPDWSQKKGALLEEGDLGLR